MGGGYFHLLCTCTMDDETNSLLYVFWFQFPWLSKQHEHQYCDSSHEQHHHTIEESRTTGVIGCLNRAIYNVKRTRKEIDSALISIREYEDNVWTLKEPLYESDSLFTAQDEDVVRRARNITLKSACGMTVATGVFCHVNRKVPGFLGGILSLSAGMIRLVSTYIHL